MTQAHFEYRSNEGWSTLLIVDGENDVVAAWRDPAYRGLLVPFWHQGGGLDVVDPSDWDWQIDSDLDGYDGPRDFGDQCDLPDAPEHTCEYRSLLQAMADQRDVWSGPWTRTRLDRLHVEMFGNDPYTPNNCNACIDEFERRDREH